MHIISNVDELKEKVLQFKVNKKTVGYVPTLGGIHKGHLRLIRFAKKKSDIVVVSIFLNPVQFDSKKDFSKYPRNIFQDKKAETIVLCSENRFTQSKTHFCNYLPVKEENNKLSPLHSLKTLAEQGITSVLLEGGQEVLRSYISEDVIDQIIRSRLDKMDESNG